MSKKNGEIEFLRFVFAMIIVVFHFNKSFHLNIFSWGRIGVEFFFLVTGALLGKSAKSKQVAKDEIPNYTYMIVKRKISSFYPYYLMAILLQMIFLRILIQKNSLKNIILNIAKALPRILLFDSAGFRMDNSIRLGVDWYLASMILSIIILYPILLYAYNWASRLIFPIIGLFGLGIMNINYGSISAHEKIIVSILDAQMVRGFCDIALGIWGYEMSQNLNKWKVTQLSKNILSVLKWICYAITIIYAYYGFNKQYSIVAFTFCLIGVIFSFSKITYNIPYNSFTEFLGKLSLPLYLTHNTIRKICAPPRMSADTDLWKVYVIICLCPLIAYIFQKFTNIIVNEIKKVKPLFVEI